MQMQNLFCYKYLFIVDNPKFFTTFIIFFNVNFHPMSDKKKKDYFVC